MTTLNEAIKRFESNAEFEKRNGNLQGCLEFGQLTEWLKDYKRLLEQEPMREFTEEEAKAYSKALDKMYKPTGFNVFDEPCEDVVSRQDVLKTIVEQYDAHYEVIPSWLDFAQLQSVQPKTGHWIAYADGIWIKHYECSECGKRNSTHSDYCPNCGAKMVEPQESEENAHMQKKQTEIIVTNVLKKKASLSHRKRK